MLVYLSVLLVSLFAFPSADAFGYPWHASCNIKWVVDGSCDSFKSKIVNQINAWQGDSLCPTTTSDSCPAMPCGQNCLYDLVSADGSKIEATHKTPVKRYIDDLTFEMNESNGKCSVDAKSSSRLWYAVLDMGTNYCNLRNLLDGAGYTSEMFTEETRDAVCTQYSSRDCSRF